MPKQWKKLAISESANYEDRPEANYFWSVHPPVSNYQTIKDNILAAINTNDSVELVNLLTDHFIYRKGEQTYSSFYRGGHHSKRWELQYFLVKPVIELLFFDHLIDFKEILVAVQTKNASLQGAFIDAFLRPVKRPTTIRPSDIFTQVLTPLNSEQLIALRQEIARLRQADPTHVAAQILADDLSSGLNYIPSSQNGLAQLEFKLNLIETLHSKDSALAQDKNLRCIFVNIAMILLGFVPNLFNLMLTGDFLFFKQTPQQASVERMNSHFDAFKAPRESSDLEECPEDGVCFMADV